jgi:predicted small secreted protein
MRKMAACVVSVLLLCNVLGAAAETVQGSFQLSGVN